MREVYVRKEAVARMAVEFVGGNAPLFLRTSQKSFLSSDSRRQGRREGF